MEKNPRRIGCTWYQLCLYVCVEKLRPWVLCRPQVSEMSETFSLKMGVKFDITLCIGEKLPQRSYAIMRRN